MCCPSRKNMFSVMANSGFGGIVVTSKVNNNQAIAEFGQSAIFANGKIKKTAMRMANQVIKSGEITRDKVLELASRGVTLRVNF